MNLAGQASVKWHLVKESPHAPKDLKEFIQWAKDKVDPPRTKDTTLWKEYSERSQQPGESVADFMADMNELKAGMTAPPNDAQEIAMLKGKFNSYLRQRLQNSPTEPATCAMVGTMPLSSSSGMVGLKRFESMSRMSSFCRRRALEGLVVVGVGVGLEKGLR
ncbi:hypothetical protein KEM55_007325 [Ascosphaera atra]|nr:hypothetical protein KEM55_007325 [Ascosphaera atra]